jgi:electron transport complex protein RnfC
VKKGDTVKKGRLIAAGSGPLSSNMHASISGRVAAILNKPHPVYGECQAIVIESDGRDEWDDGVLADRDWRSLDNAALVEIIKNAGVVGMGGAAFPSHVKLAPPKGRKIDTLIINAAECEPFLTADHRIMLEYTRAVRAGILIIKKISGVENVIVGIEDNKMDAVKAIRDVFSGSDVRVVPVPTRYPQGAEKILIKTLTGRAVPPGRLPMDAGVLVQNVSTARAIHNAVEHGRPLIERVVTVSGGAVKTPSNLLLRLGTTFEDALNMCGGFKHQPVKIIMGGPMMGIAQYTAAAPVIKGTSGILALSGADVRHGVESACIRCGRCARACPMGLNPGMLSILGERALAGEARDEHHLLDCVECGCCGFICPAKRNIVHHIRYSKKLCSEKKEKTA